MRRRSRSGAYWLSIRSRDTRDRHPPQLPCQPVSLARSPVACGWSAAHRSPASPAGPTEGGLGSASSLNSIINPASARPRSRGQVLYDDSTGMMNLDTQTHTRERRTCHLGFIASKIDSSSIDFDRRRSAKPAGISSLTSHLRPSPSRALGSLGLWRRTFCARRSKSDPISDPRLRRRHRSSRGITPRPFGPLIPIHRVRFTFRVRLLTVRCEAGHTPCTSTPVSKGRRNPSSTISSGFSLDRERKITFDSM